MHESQNAKKDVYGYELLQKYIFTLNMNVFEQRIVTFYNNASSKVSFSKQYFHFLQL